MTSHRLKSSSTDAGKKELLRAAKRELRLRRKRARIKARKEGYIIVPRTAFCLATVQNTQEQSDFHHQNPFCWRGRHIGEAEVFRLKKKFRGRRYDESFIEITEAWNKYLWTIKNLDMVSFALHFW